ncbi:hypothetical protein FRC05_000282 [Tulasnella sp. 425]|nr:hypothetical protein FRC05_000282 [Tulasnella sp. 425]
MVHDARYAPDLLDIIFSFLDMKSLKNTACVCRVWHDIAVDRIWQALPGLLPLITHFWPPWIYAKNGMMGLDDTEDHELWSRFRAYSRRVRKLDGGIGIVSQAVQNYMAKLKAAFSIEKNLEPPLPLIREIVWEAGSPEDTLALRYFVSPDMHKLSLRPAGVGADLISQLLSHLSLQNLHLTTFNLDTKWMDSEDKKLDAALASFLGSQPALEEVLFPKFYVHHSMTNILAELHRLHTFHGILRFDTPQEVESFIANLAGACPGLRHLVLYITDDSTDQDGIRFESIKPLLSCRSFVEFQILHGKPLQLHSNQIHAIGQAWPEIATLSLSPNVVRSDAPGLPLSELLHFGPLSFPRLERLAVFLDLNLAHAPNVRMALSQLKTLCVGTTPITSDTNLKSLAQHLATICSPTIRLCNAKELGFRIFVFEKDGPHDLTGRWRIVSEEMEKRIVSEEMEKQTRLLCND